MVSTQPPNVARATTLSKKAQIVLKLFMVLVGPLLCLILLEGIAFVWETKLAQGPYAWELVASRRIKIERHGTSGSPYVLMEPGSHYEWQGIQVDINSLGLRDKEITYEKPPETYRVLNLGDSVGMGWGVPVEDTYGKQLELILNEQAQAGIKYEVINASVPGWRPENELAYLQAEGLKFNPDMIVLELTIVNDIYGKSAIKEKDRPVFDWLRDHTYSWAFLSFQYQQVKASSQGKDRIPALDPPTNPIYYFPQSPDDKQWDDVWHYITKIAAIASQKKIPFILVLFPVEHQVVDPSFPRLPQMILSERAKNDGIYVVDLLPAFEEACNDKPGGKCELEDHYLFADLWMHPSALGNRITAERIFTLIKNDQLLTH